MTANYSFYAIPAYYVLAHIPQAWSIAFVKNARNGKFNNVNPRGQSTAESIKKTVPQETFECFERAKASHSNSLENLSFFAAAVICGNMARLDPQVLNLASGAVLAVRTAYILAYINITQHRFSFFRSFLWTLSVVICFYLFVASGTVMARGGPLVL